MSTLEDKILGEKRQYYCSSDEEEEEDNNEDNGDKDQTNNSTNDTTNDDFGGQQRQQQQWNRWNGYSVNTGPKGVIKDWQRYKQFESEQREADDRQKLEIMKKLSLTCNPHLDQELTQNKNNSDNEDELDDMNDPVLKEYMIKRMQEMMDQIDSNGKDRPVFGKLLLLSSGSEFLEAIDKEKKFVIIICHIFAKNVEQCKQMNQCLDSLAKQYFNIKFCAIEASVAGMSHHFSKSGVPALLVYKSGNLVANFVRLSDEFNDQFVSTDVETFLVEHGILNDNSGSNSMQNNGSNIRVNADNDDDDSD
ncbi:phosducin-like protein [Oppia nitens]|uniref:phosducin-like protein n=1 Tax=Oppia nitens TaxID=1686743 RepID=UPI0023DBE09C|nr:phosducin-like protein [Oppia nitens]